jgi:hypothetical protein
MKKIKLKSKVIQKNDWKEMWQQPIHAHLVGADFRAFKKNKDQHLFKKMKIKDVLKTCSKFWKKNYY